MGCVQSRKDVCEMRPNEFCVINIDECGNGLWTGQLEVAENELILHRRGKEPTRWPLRSLRRYGFDREIFSFESGRRCPTGEGIYAFKCRRAEQLFGTLQQCIQLRNHNNENVLDSLAMEQMPYPPGTLPRPIPDSLHFLPSHNQSEYLEPAPATAFSSTSRFSGVRLGSVGSGPLSPEVHSPGSPSNSNILEVMPLAPLPTAAAHTNLYQFQDFPLREHNNNKKSKIDSISHSYLNTGDINTDLAVLRHSLHSQHLLPDEDEPIDLNMSLNQYNNGVPLSPTLSTSSEHYAMLTPARNANNRLYMNLNSGEASNILPAICEEMNAGFALNETTMTNFNFDMDEDKHNYANLGPGEVNYDPRLLNYNQNGQAPRSLIGNMNIACDPQSEAATKINYAVLDLDKNDDDLANDNVQSLPPSSPKKPVIGYTIIDFNKTEALTSVALGTEVDTEGSRKTRHNSSALPPSPTVA